jgi:hypothetical protein
MNAIQKATAAAMAITITLVGATLATAPLTLAASQQVVSRAYHWSSAHHHVLASDQQAAASSAQVG